ncbi:MAG: hypothetical protein NC246_03715 [Muribaculaceae bacterium]|nr:hypothetical protein [Muribaculaceae bacterium]
MGKLQERLENGWADRLWYMFCFALFGLIDQRRGSAEGSVQMIFANMTGIVTGMLLLPSMKRRFWRTGVFKIWMIVCIPGTVAGCIIGKRIWLYPGQWYTAVINVAVIGCLLLYLVWDREELRQKSKLSRGCFLAVACMLVLMQVSVNEALWPGWFLLLFGCFYLIGIPEEKEGSFMQGMLAGLILWFFVQQIIAFGFRPYDYIYYRGLYSGITPNGVFYMIVFCAFTGAWLWSKSAGAGWLMRIFCFLLSAGSLGFQLLTGRRASLFGAIAAAVLAYMAYDIIMRKSFRHWIPQGILLAACMVALVPAVYGCVRYLPTILHHPVWFQGEYDADTSVHSYDPWDSERYISFERVVNENISRIVQVVGIELYIEDGHIRIILPAQLSAQAAEEPGRSAENPFVVEGTDITNSSSIRKAIYAYHISHLNFTGHSKEDAGVYLQDGFYGHAHNMFLQIAYDHGIVAGIIFLVWNLWCLIRLLLRKDMQGIIYAAFLVAILVYGCAEMAVTTGQITMVILFIDYYFGMKKSILPMRAR